MMQQSTFAPFIGGTGNILIPQQSINQPQQLLTMPSISTNNNVAVFNSTQMPTQMNRVFVNNTALCIQQQSTGRQQLMCSPAISAIQIPIRIQPQQQQSLFVTNANGLILGTISYSNNNYLSNNMPRRINHNISLNDNCNSNSIDNTMASLNNINGTINFTTLPPIPNFTLPYSLITPTKSSKSSTPVANNLCQNEPITKTVSKPDKKFVCAVCGKKYKYLCNYKSHFKIHTDDCYKCQFCGKKFGRKSNYTEHVRVHTGESPFKCTYCNKRFKQRHGWKDHLRVHTGEKPYQCNICQRRFSVGHNLNVHKRIHTGEKPFKCNLCDKAYRQKSAYNSHVKNIHGI